MNQIVAERKLTMKASGRAFRLLSDTLYQDKPLAMVRETIHNGLDAHRAVGKMDTPFHVHLPNSAEPFFAVRDFGPSITDEKMTEVYCTYFNSTKATDGVVFAGRLGLGSKSPLAMSDSFTVSTYLDGTKRVYTIFYDSDNEPAVSPAMVSQTSEPNGLEVHVKIEPGDFAKVIDAARKVLAFFDPMPLISNGPKDFNPGKPDYDLIGDGFAVRACINSGKGYHSYRYASFEGKPRAIMGHMVYPIDLDLVEVSDELKAVLALPIDIFFPLGALDFVPSREALSYDKVMTLPGIRKALRSIVKQLKVSLNTRFANCTSEGSARRKYAELCTDGKPFADIVKITKGVDWTSPEGVHQIIDSPNYTVPDDVNLRVYSPGNRAGTVRQGYTKAFPSFHNIKLYRNDRVKPSDKLVAAQARREFSYHEKGSMYLLSGPMAAQDAFLATLDNADVELTSELTDDTPRVRQVMPKRFNNNNRPQLDKDGIYDGWVDMERGGYYVLTSHSELIEGLSYNRAQFERAFTASLEANLIDLDWNGDQFAIVGSSLSKAFVKHPKWKEFYPAMKAKAIRLLQRKDPFTIFAQEAAVESLELGYDVRRRLGQFTPGLTASHPLRVFYDTMTAWEAAHTSEVRALAGLVTVFGLSRPEPTLDYDLKATWAGINQRYPMLRYLYQQERAYSRHRDDEGDEEADAKAALQYIGLVDASPVQADNVVPLRRPRAKRAA